VESGRIVDDLLSVTVRYSTSIWRHLHRLVGTLVTDMYGTVP